MSDSVRPGTNVMPTVPNSARIWNYAQNGQDNYQVDRDLADVMMRDFPEIKTAAMESRAFQERVAEYVVRDGGVRQLLDLGTGIPTGSGTHGLAQKAAPESRVVYVDNDPVVLNHASSLRSSPEGKIHYLQQDFRNVDAVLEDAARTLNLDEPVALLVLSTLGHFPPAEAAALVGAYMSGSPPVPTWRCATRSRLPARSRCRSTTWRRTRRAPIWPGHRTRSRPARRGWTWWHRGCGRCPNWSCRRASPFPKGRRTVCSGGSWRSSRRARATADRGGNTGGDGAGHGTGRGSVTMSGFGGHERVR